MTKISRSAQGPRSASPFKVLLHVESASKRSQIACSNDLETMIDFDGASGRGGARRGAGADEAGGGWTGRSDGGDPPRLPLRDIYRKQGLAGQALPVVAIAAEGCATAWSGPNSVLNPTQAQCFVSPRVCNRDDMSWPQQKKERNQAKQFSSSSSPPVVWRPGSGRWTLEMGD
jgi:hypothetical protein